jgi:hypothetical protein
VGKFAAYEEQIEGLIDKLGSLTASVELKELERSSLVRIKNGDLAVNNRAFRTEVPRGALDQGELEVQSDR